MNLKTSKWTSRKFLLALLASLIAFANAYFGLNMTTDQLITIISPLLLYIGAEGAADTVERLKTGAVKQEIAAQGQIPAGFELSQVANGLVPGPDKTVPDGFTSGQ